jgi:hypothetical protein
VRMTTKYPLEAVGPTEAPLLYLERDAERRAYRVERFEYVTSARRHLLRLAVDLDIGSEDRPLS